MKCLIAQKTSPKFVLLNEDSIRVNVLAFSPDGKTFASGHNDKFIRLWDATSGKLIKPLEGHSSEVKTLIFSSDGKYLVSGSFDKTIKLWELPSGQPIRTFKDPLVRGVNTVTISSDNKFIVSVNGDEAIRVWDVSSGRLIQKLVDPQLINYQSRERAYPSTIYTVAISQNGKYIVSGVDYTIKLWKTTSWELVRSIPAHENTIYTLAFSPNSNVIASGSWDKTIKLWNVSTGEPLRTLKENSSYVMSVAFSPDGKILASGSLDNTIIIWEVSTGKILDIRKEHSSSVETVAFSPNGKILASGSLDTSIRFWRIPDGKLMATMHCIDKEDYVVYTPQGYYFASDKGEKVAAWRINEETYLFEQYSDIFRSSDLVAKTLRNEPIPVPKIRLSSDIPPTLILEQIKSLGDGEGEIVLRYSGSHNLDRIVYFCNGEQDAISRNDRPNSLIKFRIRLMASNNSGRIVAIDKNNLKSQIIKIGDDEVFSHKGVKETNNNLSTLKLGSYGKKYAIIIGIANYKNLESTSTNKNKLTDLKYADQDAIKFKKFLDDSTISGGNWNSYLLINENATEKKIDEIFVKILKNTKPQDLIFIFFSGHARSHPEIEKDVYLLSYDFEIDNPRSGYFYQNLLDLIINSKAEHIIAFIDACRSGIIGFGKGGLQGSFSQDVFGERLSQIPENKVIFSSGQGTQISWEDRNLKHGVFTYYLLKGLRGEAKESKNPRFVDLGELEEYVQWNVFEHTSNDKKMSPQKPRLWEANGVTNEDFPVAIRK